MVALPIPLKGESVMVLGAGVSGMAAARLLLHIGAQVSVVEDNPEVAQAAQHLDVPVYTMQEAISHVPETSLVVTSPGLPPHHSFFKETAKADIPVWGDVELCWHVDKAGLCGPSRVWIAVTGTNGKTTTTAMTTDICCAAGMNAVACGNIGYPIEDALLDPAHPDVLVCELSSFQLHWAPSIKPLAGAVLNVDEDHIDWHGSVDAYAQAKAQVLNGLYAVVGRDDKRARELGEECAAHNVIGFRMGEPLRGEIGVHEEGLFDNAFGPNETVRFLIECADITPSGPAGILDAGAAAALSMAAGAMPEHVNKGLQNFEVAPHRNNVILEQEGIAYVDDSKATNPHAARSSMLGYENIVWIAGGQLKDADIAPLIKEVKERLRGAVILGKDGDIIVRELKIHCPDIPVVRITTGDDGTDVPPPLPVTEQAMREAVTAAHEIAQPGDTVVLAPAAASYDMFRGYGHRGDLFAEYVCDLYDLPSSEHCYHRSPDDKGRSS
ncbi:MAG: UDP-N-acetylmuramoyl-L-alanine--D-glutamate ligase [Lawsonella sp.]